MKKIVLLITILLCTISANIQAHNISASDLPAKSWGLKNGTFVQGWFMMIKNNNVYLELKNGAVVHYPIAVFSEKEKGFISEKYSVIKKENESLITTSSINNSSSINSANILLILSILFLSGYFIFRLYNQQQTSLALMLTIVSISGFLWGFTNKTLLHVTSITNPLTVDSAFTPFKPNVVTTWDTTNFYVQSHGIPTTHNMMIGITAWQQQVPLPQCYTGNNFWTVPLNPVMAANPIPVSPAHFSRGAIAIAVNGIPIFNPYTNTGVDAFLDGQLDNWGGHCGRADDYHYHIAPMHLYGFTASTLPIAYAFDGFAVYGSVEPDGTPMQALDANHGHYGPTNVYHYHGSAAAPYMIANMAGVVTEDTTHQLIPQARAYPVRPSLTPLSGAVITNLTPNTPNGYVLTYTLGGQNYQVAYSWTSTGHYTYNFINPTGTTTSNYNGFTPCAPFVGIEENTTTASLDVYPNPTLDLLNIGYAPSITKGEIVNVTVLSSTGQQVFTHQGFTNTIETKGLPKGVYFLLIKTTSANYSKKFIVE
jgi:hypothetical protein